MLMNQRALTRMNTVASATASATYRAGLAVTASRRSFGSCSCRQLALEGAPLAGGRYSLVSPLHHPSPRRLRQRRGTDLCAAAQKRQFSSFEDLLSGSEQPLLVDFYATWCGPCQMMSPVLTTVAARLKGRVQVVKIDTDKYPGIASQYRVQALPTLALFVGGKMVFRFEGMLTEGQLLERVNYYLAGSGAAEGQGAVVQ